MNWQTIRENYPSQWLIIEALAAHTNTTGQRLIDRIAIGEHCDRCSFAVDHYRLLHQAYPDREFYFVHTDRTNLDIHEISWMGDQNHPCLSPFERTLPNFHAHLY